MLKQFNEIRVSVPTFAAIVASMGLIGTGILWAIGGWDSIPFILLLWAAFGRQLLLDIRRSR